jgi:hypothetical protein
MTAYCGLDVEVSKKLLRRIRARGFSKQALDMEMELQQYLHYQQEGGINFNEEEAHTLQGQLVGEKFKVEARLKEAFGGWFVKEKEFTPKRDLKRYGYVKGATCSKIKWVEFNPGSRLHIADRMIKLYGWKPEQFTDGGQPEINEGVLKGMDFPEAPDLRRYLLLDKRLSQLAEGPQAWLRHVREDGRIYGSVNGNGTVTHRGSHAYPNLGQTVKVTSPFGRECRELFEVPEGWDMLGSDAMGLELRMLGHYMARYDDGAYIKALLEEDVHSMVQGLLGIEDREDAGGRHITKTFEYAHLYGAGNAKLGEIIDPALKGHEDRAKRVGQSFRKKYESRLPALGFLVKAVHKKAKRGYLTALDGRRIHVRSEHAALNALLQCAGSLVVKNWVVLSARQF